MAFYFTVAAMESSTCRSIHKGLLGQFLLSSGSSPPSAPTPATSHSRCHCNASAEVRIDAVENDEVIAHALQEELTQVAMAEASGASFSTADGQRDTVLVQQWFRPEIVSHLPSAPPYVEEEELAEGSWEPFSSCSSPEDNNGQGCSIELVENFSALDGEVGKRLNDMVPVPLSSCWCCTAWLSSRLTEMTIVSFGHCLINFTVLLNTIDLYGSK